MSARPSRRTVGLAAAGAGTAAALSACGGGSGSSDGPVTLRFTWWGSDTRQRYTQQIIDAWNAENPDVQVKGEFTEWSGYWDRLATTTAANDSPDVLQMDAAYLRSYADRGALLDLSQHDELDTTGIAAETLRAGESQGGLYGLIIGVAPLAFVANPALFAQAGVALPDDTRWTWDDYLTTGAAITAAGLPGVYGVQTEGLNNSTLENWAVQQGEVLFTEDGAVGVSAEVLADFWAYQLDLVSRGAGLPPSLAVERSTAGTSMDQSGTGTNTVAVCPWWSTQLTALTRTSGQELRLLRPPAPTPGGNSGLYEKASMYWSVSARSEHPDEAVRFVNFLSQSDTSTNLMLTERGIPASTTVRDRIRPQLAPTDAAVVAYVDGIADVVNPAPPVAPAGGSAAAELTNRYGSDVLFGRRTPQDAGTAYVEELQSAVDSA